jgi:DDE superfamily endonuclease
VLLEYKKFALSNLLGVDALGFITTSICGYSGNTSDSVIFKFSEAHRATEGVQGANMEAAHPPGYCVVVDSGFSQRMWIMTPLEDHQ